MRAGRQAAEPRTGIDVGQALEDYWQATGVFLMPTDKKIQYYVVL